ncbi:MAG: hypothetical protein WDN08_04775 [Rhizomicrobium sp.]
MKSLEVLLALYETTSVRVSWNASTFLRVWFEAPSSHVTASLTVGADGELDLVTGEHVEGEGAVGGARVVQSDLRLAVGDSFRGAPRLEGAKLVVGGLHRRLLRVGGVGGATADGGDRDDGKHERKTGPQVHLEDLSFANELAEWVYEPSHRTFPRPRNR